MITKAIIEEIIDQYNIRVRIPFYNKIATAPGATPTDELAIATVCSLSNSRMNYQVGDIVFLGFEDHSIHKPVILGQLSRENGTAQNAELALDSLTVNVDTHLSSNTFIGDVTGEEISKLKGVNENLQFQLEILAQRIAKLEGDSPSPGPTPSTDIPYGLIAIWSGLDTDIPYGWHLCDGTVGTPDLRDKFILGASKNIPAGMSQDTNVNQEDQELTPEITLQPIETFNLQYNSSGLSVPVNWQANSKQVLIEGYKPPYYALCYIMRVGENI